MKKLNLLLLLICLMVLPVSCKESNIIINGDNTDQNDNNENEDNNEKLNLNINWEEIIISKGEKLSLMDLVDNNFLKMAENFEYVYNCTIDDLMLVNNHTQSLYQVVKNTINNIDFEAALVVSSNNNSSLLLIECFNNEDAEKIYEYLSKMDNINWIKHKNFVFRVSAPLICLIEGDYKYKNNSMLNLSENIFEIDFSSKYKNTFIKIPNQILYVCTFSCKFNKNLKKLYCNSNLIGIGEGAFYSCDNLQEIYLNDKLLFIGDKVFYNCSINNIVVPESVEKMGYHVFNSGNIFCNFDSKPKGWDENFYTGTAKVYYKGQWDYDDEGNPYVINTNI